MDPAVTKSLPQSLVGDVQADYQVKLIQTVQGQSLCQRPGEAWPSSRDRRKNVRQLKHRYTVYHFCCSLNCYAGTCFEIKEDAVQSTTTVTGSPFTDKLSFLS